MNDIIDGLRRRLEQGLTDLGPAELRGLPAPALPAALAADERALGFALPEPLRRAYLEIANGGFGPGYGLIGMTDGAMLDTGQTAVELYESLREPDPGDANWSWPEGLLPVCHWGCAIYSCADCTRSPFPVRLFDPNLRDETFAECFFDEAASLEEWLAAWSRGEGLWDRMYGDDGPIAALIARRRNG